MPPTSGIVELHCCSFLFFSSCLDYTEKTTLFASFLFRNTKFVKRKFCNRMSTPGARHVLSFLRPRFPPSCVVSFRPTMTEVKTESSHRKQDRVFFSFRDFSILSLPFKRSHSGICRFSIGTSPPFRHISIHNGGGGGTGEGVCVRRDKY